MHLSCLYGLHPDVRRRGGKQVVRDWGWACKGIKVPLECCSLCFAGLGMSRGGQPPQHAGKSTTGDATHPACQVTVWQYDFAVNSGASSL